MRNRHHHWLLLTAAALLLLARPAVAARIQWLTDVDEASRLAVSQQRPLLIFVTMPRCRYCAAMKHSTFADEAVASQVNASFVPVILDASSGSPLVEDLNISAYPTTVVMSPAPKVTMRIRGYLPAHQLKQRLDAALERSEVKRR